MTADDHYDHLPSGHASNTECPCWTVSSRSDPSATDAAPTPTPRRCGPAQLVTRSGPAGTFPVAMAQRLHCPADASATGRLQPATAGCFPGLITRSSSTGGSALLLRAPTRAARQPPSKMWMTPYAINRRGQTPQASRFRPCSAKPSLLLVIANTLLPTSRLAPKPPFLAVQGGPEAADVRAAGGVHVTPWSRSPRPVAPRTNISALHASGPEPPETSRAPTRPAA